ncbi:MAG: hypothetical protein JSS13_03135, partial [Proteobacteria bacterium]|nr:hypothetical protein [Pseudomonadota bacterium]
MSRLIAILFALFVPACANVASAQTTLETFEGSANTTGNTSFVSNGTTFDIVTNSSWRFAIDSAYPGTGWNGTAADNKYIDNDGLAVPPNPAPSPNFSLKTHDGSPFTVGSFWLYLAGYTCGQGPTCIGQGGSVTLTGKLSGATVFTASASSGFTTSISTTNGFSKIDLTTFGGSNNASKKIDELQIVTGGNFQYVALDALTWTKLVSYTVGTAVSPNSAYGTISCVLTSVSPGGSTTCTAAPNAGYEVDNISGCGGTTSFSTTFTTGAINASCTVTATFVVALGASTSKTDV